MKPVIETHALCKSYHGRPVVDHLNLTVPEGCVYGFLGPNGAGKSTTMKMLTGLLPASEGEAWLFGQPVDPKDIATRQRVGYMSQAFSLYSELSVRQNLELHARLFHIPDHEIAGRVAEMSKRFMLTEVEDALPADLPLGIRQQKQRIGLRSVLAVELSDLALIGKVRPIPQPLHNGVYPVPGDVIIGHAAVKIGFHPLNAPHALPQHIQPFFRRKQGLFLIVDHHQRDHPVKQAGGAADDIHMAPGHRVKAAGTNCCRHDPTTSLCRYRLMRILPWR